MARDKAELVWSELEIQQFQEAIPKHQQESLEICDTLDELEVTTTGAADQASISTLQLSLLSYFKNTATGALRRCLLAKGQHGCASCPRVCAAPQ